ncbi:MAG: hypothetical protein Q4F06_08025 [Eubacteriales bacterium]|nr:hypothetical protein [Eubacteriales bacterium]
MRLNSLKLEAKNVFTNPSKVCVVSTGKYRGYNSSKDSSRDFDGYTLTCSARKNDSIKIKVPKSLSASVTQISEALEADKQVYINFPEIEFKAYSFISEDGKLLSGVSSEATEFNIISITDSNDDVIDL